MHIKIKNKKKKDGYLYRGQNLGDFKAKFTSRILIELSTIPRIRLMSMPYRELIDIICLSVKLDTVSASNPENASLMEEKGEAHAH